MDRRARPVALASAAYLTLAVLAWWHVWSAGGTGAVAGGSADVAQDVWWLAWVPHAMAHGANPLFTTAMFWPAGVNVMANTSILLPALALSPLTALFGPVAAFNVGVTVAPALDALVAFVVFRRYVRFEPAAFAGGLVFGFGPFVTTDLRYGHLHLTVLALFPVMLALADRILVHQRGSPWRAGTLLALVVIAQFLVSAEMLALAAVLAAAVLCAAVVVGLWRRGPYLRSRVAYALRALGTTALLSGAALGYPLWWYTRGPRHFTGAVFGDMSRFSASLEAIVVPHAQLAPVGFLSGGNGDYLGWPLVALLLVACAVWRRDRVLLAASGLGAFAAVLALGPRLHVGHGQSAIVMPEWLVSHLPLLSSLAPSRFGAGVDLLVALAVSRVIDDVRQELSRKHRRAGGQAAAYGLTWVAGLCMVLPPVVSLWPYATVALREPAPWSSSALRSLPEATVVREYPPVSGADAEVLLWQAVEGLHVSTVDGYAIVPGPGGHAVVREPPEPVGEVLAALWLGRLRPPVARSTVDALRAHVWDDGVGALLVVPARPGADAAVALLTEALGAPDARPGGGWLWRSPASPEGTRG